MLSLIDKIAGRPWAIDARVAAQVRGIVARDGFGGLRQFAELKRGIHGYQDDEDRNERQAARRGERGATVGSVVVIPVVGTMTQRGDWINSAPTRSTAALADEVSAAAAEPKIDAIVLEVDSPGGEVFGVPEAWAAIRAAGKHKPVVAHANSLMASAALYVSSAAKEIWVTPSGEVGSVGVYALHVDMSKALEAEGERWEFVEADDSPFKVEGNPTGPLTDDGRAQIKKAVNRYMSMFTRDLARGRKVAVEHVRENFGKGRVLGPQEAVAARMVDSVGTLDQAIRRAADLARERRQPSEPAKAEESGPETVADEPAAPEPVAALAGPDPGAMDRYRQARARRRQ